MKTLLPLMVPVFLLVGCDKLAPGEACEATGDGFTRKDPCEETCVEWEVTCPDGQAVTPSVCSDGSCSTDSDCDSDWFCGGGHCLPLEVCPEADWAEPVGAPELPVSVTE